jgi:uncharacterized protein (UPF0332 family)
LTEFDDCFRKKLLVKTKASKDLAGKSLRRAKHFLEKANTYLKLEDAETISIHLYYAFFQAARGLLFRDGIKERSHYCTLIYLEHSYVKKRLISREHLDILRTLKETRQEIQYGFIVDSSFDLDTLKEYLIKCKDFIKIVEDILGGS